MGFLTALRGTTTGELVKSASVGFPTQGFLPALGSMPTASGMLVSQATALNVSTVYSCVRIRSRDLARCTPQILQNDGKGNKTSIADHPLVAVFNKPNRVQTWFEFAEQMHVAFLLRSNAYAVVLRDRRGNPRELIPLNPDIVTPMEAPDGSIFYTVARAGMWLASVLADEPITIPARDVLHIRDLTFNSLVGVSRIAFARDAIGLAMVQEQQAARWSGNGARPAGVLQSGKTLSAETAARLKAQWQTLQAGYANTGNTAVLEDGVEWKPMALTSVDLEFISARLVQVKEIARFFEVPLHKLGENESLPRASIAELNADYVQNVVMSDATRWEQKIAATFGIDLIPNVEVKFDERGLLRADFSTMINSARTAIMGGLVTQNEGRAYIGYGPMADADVLLHPVNLAPSGSAIDNVAPDGAGRPPDGKQPGAAKRFAAEVAKHVAEALQKFNPDQPRDAHGRFGSGGSSEGGEDSGSGTISHNVKLIAQGVALTAAAALATALAPEAGVVAVAALAVTGIADKMFIEAGVSSATAILAEHGITGESAESFVSSLSNMSLKSIDPQLAKAESAAIVKLAGVADVARDALVDKIAEDHPQSLRLGEVTTQIDESRRAYKAALSKITVADDQTES